MLCQEAQHLHYNTSVLAMLGMCAVNQQRKPIKARYTRDSQGLSSEI